jgi:antitoxin HicB
LRTIFSQALSNAAMVCQIGTSRSALDRLLDPDNASVTLGTLQRAASVVEKRLRLDLVDARSVKRENYCGED